MDSTYGGLWARFVVDQLQCNGVIAIEGGDATYFKYVPTIALYKLSPSFISDKKSGELTKDSQ